MLSAVYARGAAWRRWWYARPGARRRLSRPVVSVGALAAGGSGKTPVAALVAELLRDAGERPAVLSRGYGRRVSTRGVVVVRDPDRLRAGIDTAGDEPRMLAERLDGVSVLVCRDRYRAGRMAETRLGSDRARAGRRIPASPARPRPGSGALARGGSRSADVSRRTPARAPGDGADG